MVFVILRSRVVDKVDIACVGVSLEGGNKVFMNGVVVAVYPAYPPPISSCQCLRITDSTCLLFVIIYHYYSEVRNLTMGYYLSPTNFVVVGVDAWRNAPPGRFVESYLSHITNTAVLWRVVFGGRMFTMPCLARLQVIVIAPPTGC